MPAFSKKRYEELRNSAIDAAKLVRTRKHEMVAAHNAYVTASGIYHDLCNDLFEMVGKDVGLKPINQEKPDAEA